MKSLPPVAVAPLVVAAGVAASRFGALLTVAPLVVAVLLLAPIEASRRPRGLWIFFVLAAAGLISGLASDTVESCPSEATTITGHFLAKPRGGSTPFRVDDAGCDIRVVADHDDGILAGRRVQLGGTWRQGRAGPWFLVASSDLVAASDSPWRWASVRWRASLVECLHERYGERGALLSALILEAYLGLSLAGRTRDCACRWGCRDRRYLAGRGTLELIVLDVGQGDVIAIRTPRARWVLIDVGPSGGDDDPSAHPVVRELRKRGARRLEGLVLTHPDLDHIGGAPAVLSSPTVDVVIDPARSSPKRAYVELLELARERRGRLGRLARGRPVDVGWSRLRRARA